MTAPLHVVVGASGQVGTHLVRALESAGHRVRADKNWDTYFIPTLSLGYSW